MPTTKWSVLEARRDRLAKELAEAEHHLEGLQNTSCNLTCAGCGTHLATEADFAKHFVITDTRFLNLGWCPVADRNKLRNQS